MRPLNEKNSFERKSNARDFNKICFVVPEGDSTEVQYFEGLKKSSDYLNLNKRIHLTLLENEEKEFGQSHLKRKISNFENSVKEGKIGYLKDIDRVAFIADRDPQNFKEEQYDEIVKQCVKAGYELYISNPTFELFLLMHDDRIFNLDRKQMIENRKISSKRFLETKVNEFFGHNKRHLVFDIYKDRIAIAIKNEKKFCEDLKELKSNLGSNVGLFLDSLIRH